MDLVSSAVVLQKLLRKELKRMSSKMRKLGNWKQRIVEPAVEFLVSFPTYQEIIVASLA